jgi:hypothetical protein
MSSSILSQASAFHPGSDLWILPELEKSHWTEQIDWYLNFQISRSGRHTLAALPEYLNEVLTETGLNLKKPAVSLQNPLMIASHSLLPNRWIVIIPWESDIEKWASQAFDIWQKLNRPSLRVFLPPGQNAGALLSSHQTPPDFQEFTVVLD